MPNVKGARFEVLLRAGIFRMLAFVAGGGGNIDRRCSSSYEELQFPRVRNQLVRERLAPRNNRTKPRRQDRIRCALENHRRVRGKFLHEVSRKHVTEGGKTRIAAQSNGASSQCDRQALESLGDAGDFDGCGMYSPGFSPQRRGVGKTFVGLLDQGVEGAADSLHGGEVGLGEHFSHHVFFLFAYAVFAGDGAAHFDAEF